jgi:hypothetical protein
VFLKVTSLSIVAYLLLNLYVHTCKPIQHYLVGKFYLVDASYTCRTGFLSPYRPCVIFVLWTPAETMYCCCNSAFHFEFHAISYVSGYDNCIIYVKQIAGNGGVGFVTAASMLPGSVVVVAAAVATVADGVVAAGVGGVAAGAVAAGVDGPAAASRLPMRWTSNTSGFILRSMTQLIESEATADKGFKDKEVNQVAKALREYSGEEVSST